MKKRAKLTVYRSGIDLPVSMSSGGESELRQDPPTFVVTLDEADDVRVKLLNPNAVLAFDVYGGEHWIPVRQVAHVQRHDFAPAPAQVDLYEGPGDTLYLARADEDEDIIYRLPDAAPEDVGDDAFGSAAYAWAEDGETPADHDAKVCQMYSLRRSVDGPLVLVASCYNPAGNGNVKVVLTAEGTVLAGPKARAYIDQKWIDEALTDQG